MDDPVQERVDKVLGALTELIIEMVRSQHITRFEEAKRLCDAAQSITQLKGRLTVTVKKELLPPAPAPVEDQEHNNEDPYQQNNVQRVRPPRLGPAREVQGRLEAAPGQILFDDQGNLVNEEGIIWTGSLDSHALMRHMLMTFGPHAQTGAEANRARVAAEEAAELKTLSQFLETTTGQDRDIVARRVKQLRTNMDRRSAEMKDEDQVPVVPADHQRRHPLGALEPEADTAPGVGTDGGGGPCNGGLAQAGPLDPVGTHAVV